jgi:uncharacterized membrane protein HdeD (DUF308 family)
MAAPRTWPWAGTAVLGAIALAAGLWLLLGPMHTAFGQNCGSALHLTLPPADVSAPYFCSQDQASHLEGGWSLAAVGAVAAAIGAARLAVLRREAWLWA